MKVWGMLINHSGFATFSHRTQARVIVAAPSRAAAGRAFGVGASTVREFCSETGNATEIEIANAEPGVVFYLNTKDRQYRRLSDLG